MNIKKIILAVTAILTMGFSAQAQMVLVSSLNSGTIGLYNATTGATINSQLVTGLNGPYGVTHDSSAIYVSNIYTGIVSKYDLLTGAVINPSFLAVASPTGLLVNDGILYVANNTGIATFDAITGASLNPSFLSMGVRLFELHNNQLYVTNYANNVVGVYGLDGTTIDADFASVVDSAGIAFSGNSMFVSSANNQTVAEYDATTGALIGTPITSASGLNTPIGVAVNSDGYLLVADIYGSVRRYEADGTLVDSSFFAGTNGPVDLDFVSVPEPSVVALIVASGVAFIFIRKRRSAR